MKKLLILIFVLAGYLSHAQYVNMVGYGYKEKRIKPDSVLHLPVINDSLLHTVDTSAQIRIIDNNIYWHYGYWRPFGSGGGGGLTLQTNGANNGSQSLLNLQQGTNIALTDNGTGTVTIDGTGGLPGGNQYDIQTNNPLGTFYGDGGNSFINPSGGWQIATNDGSAANAIFGNGLGTILQASEIGGASQYTNLYLFNGSGGGVSNIYFDVQGGTMTNTRSTLNIYPDSTSLEFYPDNYTKHVTFTADKLNVLNSTYNMHINLDSAAGTAPNVIGKDGSGNWHVYQTPSGGGGGGQRFAIEDNTGITNRYNNFQNNDLRLDSLGNLYLNSGDRTFAGVASSILLHNGQTVLLSQNSANNYSAVQAKQDTAGLFGASPTDSAAFMVTPLNYILRTGDGRFLNSDPTKFLSTNSNGNLVLATGGGISLTDLSADPPLFYNNTTGNFTIGDGSDVDFGGQNVITTGIIKGIFNSTSATRFDLINSAGTLLVRNTNTSGFSATNIYSGITGNRTYTFQDADGTVAYLSDVALKVNISDTSAMLSPYLRSNVAAATYQPLDADLTTIAGLTATTDNFLVSVSSAWASRTPAQVKTTLALNNVDNTSDATKNSASVTLTNKTITAPVISSIVNTGTLTLPTVTGTLVQRTQASITSSGTPTPTGDAIENDLYITAQNAPATFGAPSGTPSNGNYILIRVKDDGTSRNLNYNAIYRASTDLPLPAQTIISKTLYLKFIYNSADSKWDLLSVLGNF